MNSFGLILLVFLITFMINAAIVAAVNINSGPMWPNPAYPNLIYQGAPIQFTLTDLTSAYSAMQVSIAIAEQPAFTINVSPTMTNSQTALVSLDTIDFHTFTSKLDFSLYAVMDSSRPTPFVPIVLTFPVGTPSTSIALQVLSRCDFLANFDLNPVVCSTGSICLPTAALSPSQTGYCRCTQSQLSTSETLSGNIFFGQTCSTSYPVITSQSSFQHYH